MKSLKTMLAVLVTATVGCILIGCSSDEWFGINNDSVTGTQTRAKTCNKLYSQHTKINNETTTRKVIYYIDYTKGDHNVKAVSPELITAIYPF